MNIDNADSLKRIKEIDEEIKEMQHRQSCEIAKLTHEKRKLEYKIKYDEDL